MIGNLRDDEHGGGGRHLELPQAGAPVLQVQLVAGAGAGAGAGGRW